MIFNKFSSVRLFRYFGKIKLNKCSKKKKKASIGTDNLSLLLKKREQGKLR